MNQSCFLIGYSSGQGGPVADQGEGPGGSAPLILDQTEAQKAVKNFVRDRLSPPPLPAPPIWRPGSSTVDLYFSVFLAMIL